MDTPDGKRVRPLNRLRSARGQRPSAWIGAILLSFLIAVGCAPTVQQESGVISAPKSVPGAQIPKPYRVNGKWYQPIPDASGFRQRGTASWYGKQFHGRKTSNGEVYDMYGLSAAHKTLPMGTVVKVRNLSNQRTLDLRINDRGPFVRGRIIDLSYGAAKKLGVVGPGTAPVEIVALAAPAETVSGPSGAPVFKPIDLYSGNFTFQVGAFQNRSNAERLRRKLSTRYQNVHIASFDRGDGLFHRVRLGRAVNLADAEQVEADLIQRGFDVFIVAE
jgi:rare lipoprotein A